MKRTPYDVIYVDPPWAYNSTQLLAKSSCLNSKDGDLYTTSKPPSLEDIGTHIQKVAADDSIMYMWVTAPFMFDAIELMKKWGWKYSTIAFVWDKGITNPGFYTLSGAEFVIVGVRGAIPHNRRSYNGPHPYKGCSHKVRQVQHHPRGKHSQKPQLFHNLIETMHPGTTKLELFARKHAPGWTCLGNELSGNDIRVDLDNL